MVRKIFFKEKVLVYVNETAGFSPELSEPWQQNWKGSWYDRAGEVHCSETVIALTASVVYHVLAVL